MFHFLIRHSCHPASKLWLFETDVELRNADRNHRGVEQPAQPLDRVIVIFDPPFVDRAFDLEEPAKLGASATLASGGHQRGKPVLRGQIEANGLYDTC